jgi:hypothetical protein
MTNFINKKGEILILQQIGVLWTDFHLAYSLFPVIDVLSGHSKMGLATSDLRNSRQYNWLG